MFMGTLGRALVGRLQCVVGIESISRPATPNATASEKRTSPAGNNNSVDQLVEIGGQESK